MATHEGRMYLCMEIQIQNVQRKQEYFHLFFLKYVTTFHSITVDFQCTRAKKQQQEYQCLEKSKYQLYTPWKHLFQEQTKDL